MCALLSKVSYLLLLSSKNVTRNRSIVFDFKQRLSKPEHTVQLVSDRTSLRLYLTTTSSAMKPPAKLPVSRRASTSILTLVRSCGSTNRVTDMKLDVVSVVVEVEEVSILPRFLLTQLLVAGLVALTGRVSAALFLLWGTTGAAPGMYTLGNLSATSLM